MNFFRYYTTSIEQLVLEIKFSTLIKRHIFNLLIEFKVIIFIWVCTHAQTHLFYFYVYLAMISKQLVKYLGENGNFRILRWIGTDVKPRFGGKVSKNFLVELLGYRPISSMCLWCITPLVFLMFISIWHWK